MSKEDKSFLIFILGVFVAFYGHMSQDVETLMIGLAILTFNQWFAFNRKKRKKPFYLLNYKLKWSTIRALWGMIKDTEAYCWHEEELPNRGLF